MTDIIMSENIIEIKNLSKKYPSSGFKLDDINLSLPRGTIMGLVGENGAGKTTLIKLTLNQINKDEGEVTIFGRDPINHEIEIKDNIGVVFSENHFSEDFTPCIIERIMRNVYSSWDENCYYNYLEIFKVNRHLKIKELSQGMKMIINLAVALSHDADLLILDEATTGLDPIARKQVHDLLNDYICDGKKSILFSTNITSDLDRIADFITFIKDGKIILSEIKDSLCENYGLLKAAHNDLIKIPEELILGIKKNKFSTEALIRNKAEVKSAYPDFVIEKITVEDIMFYMKGEYNESTAGS